MSASLRTAEGFFVGDLPTKITFVREISANASVEFHHFKFAVGQRTSNSVYLYSYLLLYY